MLDRLTCDIFNKGLEFYIPLKQYLSDLGIDIKKSNFHSDINNLISSCNFENEYTCFSKIAKNKKYATNQFNNYFEHM